MKKASIFALIILLWVPLLSYASSEGTTRSKTWNLLVPVTGVTDIGFSGTDTVSGVSDLALSGGTPFCLDGVAGVTSETLDLSSYDFDTLFIQLGTLKVLSSVTPAYSDSDATFGIFWQASETIEGLSGAEKFPIFISESITSAITPWSRPVDIIHNKYHKISFESNCTAWETSGVSIWVAKTEPDLYIPPVRTGGTTYVINANSGVSSIDTVPEGTRVTKVRTTDDISYRTDGVESGITQMRLTESQTLTLNSREQALDFRFCEWTGGSGTTVFIEHYTREQGPVVR